ncbi:hypothetical protein WA026_011595 [Henosepilachna vigintioctopunctata]|uniref:TIR domain-containing protein n=1 Tax=Henosepilachna vigintioctopunctata TaxID=420089 RepID=A0AAW1TM83_9CUCU
MKKYKITWQILILVLLVIKSNADNQICRRSDRCMCFTNADNYEFQCSENHKEEELIILHIYPNSLIRIDCTNVGLWNANKLPNVKFEKVERLQIRYCPVPENGILEIVNHFGLKNLDVLAFESGYFENFLLPTEKFDGLYNVTELRLQDNGLRTIEPNFFEHFPRLVFLELDRNQIIFQEKTFTALKRLKFLSLSDNKIVKFPENFFDGLENVEKLNLWKNNLKHIEANSFAGLKNIKSLELAYNNIERINETSLDKLSNLVNISIRSNSVKHLSREVFKSSPLLQQIEASGNSGLLLSNNVFSNFKFLKKVDLSNSRLKIISDDLFKNSTSLEIIALDKNEIEVIPKDTFKDLLYIRLLSLAFNKISQLHDDIFSSLENLEELDLQHNILEAISEDLFSKATKLKVLNLNFNNIKYIHLGAFGRNKHLVKLFMSHNRYSYRDTGIISVTPFNKCSDLQEIDLSHNEILDFPEDIMLLASMTHVNLSWNNISTLRVNALWKLTVNELKIDLEHNNLSFLDFKYVEATARNQKSLDAYHNNEPAAVINISKNKIICDCFAIDFVRYVQNDMYPGVKTAIFFLYDGVECSSPELLKGLPIENVTPSMLNCPIGDVIEGYSCTNTKECSCFWLPYDSSFLVDCAGKKLTTVPEIYQPKQHFYNQTIVHLENNLLRKGPPFGYPGYDNVSKLYLSNNLISTFDWIPPKLEVLDLHNNKMKFINYEMLENMNTTSLRNISFYGNPWRCDCDAANLTNYLRQHVHQIDINQIFCGGTSKLLINLNEKDLCPFDNLLLASATTLVLFLCVLSTLAALYYKFQQEIKVWMFAHNVLLFLVKEEELDKDKVYDAFVSYSHKDEDFVIENLISVLEGDPNPYKLCIHIRNWIPGEFITTQVATSVRDSRRTLVVLSPNFLESVWGKLEFRTAHTEAMKEGRARVIIILLGDIDSNCLDDELKTYMKTNTYIKWGDPWFWEKLRYALPHSKIKGVNARSQKHANMMKYIDDKFSLISSKNPSMSDSMTSLPKESSKKLDEKLIKKKLKRKKSILKLEMA